MRCRRGVSTIIGVMLMIVVTVLLAAAVNMYASSVSMKNRPQSAEFKAYASWSSGNITLDMLSGSPIYLDYVRIKITTDHPETSGYVNMSNVTVLGESSKTIVPGDVLKIHFIKGYDLWSKRYYASFTGPDISLWVYVGDKFRITIIDKDTGQPIWSSVLVMNP